MEAGASCGPMMAKHKARVDELEGSFSAVVFMKVSLARLASPSDVLSTCRQDY